MHIHYPAHDFVGKPSDSFQFPFEQKPRIDRNLHDGSKYNRELDRFLWPLPENQLCDSIPGSKIPHA
jgi:hypothetical protein